MNKIVEIVDVVGLHHVGGHQILHERPYLGGGVADGRTRGKHNVLPPGFFKHTAGLVIQTCTLLTIRRVDTFDAAADASLKTEVLVFVGLINQQGIYTEVIEELNIIDGTIQLLLGACLRFVKAGSLTLRVFLTLGGGAAVGRVAVNKLVTILLFYLVKLTLHAL